MYKYIFFVVLGILIYLYYNRNDNFSVGGQITQSIEQLESMVRRISIGSEDPSQKLCRISGVGQCQLFQDRLGGSCSINALAGLVYTSASFTDDYQKYLNRLGAEIMHNEQLLNAYRCVMNMQNMVDTLVSNNLNPRRTGFVNSENKLLDLNRDISILYNRLYMLFLRFKPNLNIVMGNHYFLIYRITKRKLGRLLEFMNEYKILDDSDDPNNGYMKYDEILHRLTTVYEGKNEPGEPIVDPMIDGSFGLLIIDFCNDIFDIITDQSFPITTPAERFAQVYTEDYNNNWKLKIFWFWMDFFSGSMSFIHGNGLKNVNSYSSIDDKELANRYLLENIDDLMLETLNTYRLQEDEEVEIEECDINPVEYRIALCSAFTNTISVIEQSVQIVDLDKVVERVGPYRPNRPELSDLPLYLKYVHDDGTEIELSIVNKIGITDYSQSSYNNVYKFSDNKLPPTISVVVKQLEYVLDPEIEIVRALNSLEDYDCKTVQSRIIELPVYRYSERFYTLMEVMDGSLNDLYNNPQYRTGNKLKTNVLLDILKQLASIYKCLKDRSYFYLDSKIQNVLYKVSNGRILIRLGDLGSIRYIVPDYDDTIGYTYPPPERVYKILHHEEGVSYSKFDIQNIVWGFGVVILFLNGLQNLVETYRQPTIEEFYTNIQSAIRDLDITDHIIGYIVDQIFQRGRNISFEEIIQILSVYILYNSNEDIDVDRDFTNDDYIRVVDTIREQGRNIRDISDEDLNTILIQLFGS